MQWAAKVKDIDAFIGTVTTIADDLLAPLAPFGRKLHQVRHPLPRAWHQASPWQQPEKPSHWCMPGVPHSMQAPILALLPGPMREMVADWSCVLCRRRSPTPTPSWRVMLSRCAHQCPSVAGARSHAQAVCSACESTACPRRRSSQGCKDLARCGGKMDCAVLQCSRQPLQGGSVAVSEYSRGHVGIL